MSASQGRRKMALPTLQLPIAVVQPSKSAAMAAARCHSRCGLLGGFSGCEWHSEKLAKKGVPATHMLSVTMLPRASSAPMARPGKMYLRSAAGRSRQSRVNQCLAQAVPPAGIPAASLPSHSTPAELSRTLLAAHSRPLQPRRPYQKDRLPRDCTRPASPSRPARRPARPPAPSRPPRAGRPRLTCCWPGWPRTSCPGSPRPAAGSRRQRWRGPAGAGEGAATCRMGGGGWASSQGSGEGTASAVLLLPLKKCALPARCFWAARMRHAKHGTAWYCCLVRHGTAGSTWVYFCASSCVHSILEVGLDMGKIRGRSLNWPMRLHGHRGGGGEKGGTLGILHVGRRGEDQGALVEVAHEPAWRRGRGG